MAGVQITGQGGVGKSALAGRVAGRLAETGWAVAVVGGRVEIEALVAAVTEALDAGSCNAADRRPRGSWPMPAARTGYAPATTTTSASTC